MNNQRFISKFIRIIKNNMNKKTYIIGAIILVIIGGVILSKSFSPSTQKATQTNSTKQNVSSDPQDIVPGLYTNVIKNTSTISGLKIESGLVENNIDKDGKTADDHLELVLKNNSSKDMNNFEAYYTITDLVDSKKEGYYKKLTGLTLKAGETKTIHFDSNVGENHFGVNKDGLYFTGKNKMRFDVQISTPNFMIATIQIAKDAGGAELKD
jgi:hypothetical protein